MKLFERPTPRGVGGLKWWEDGRIAGSMSSHPTRGGWIEIASMVGEDSTAVSHPTRGGWIEMVSTAVKPCCSCCPTPRGVGGLKSEDVNYITIYLGPTPRGVGGLKSQIDKMIKKQTPSHPTRGGWIEIAYDLS